MQSESLLCVLCHAVYAENSAEAREYVLKAIDIDESIGTGGSVTLDRMDIIDALAKRGNKVYSTMLARKTGDDVNNTREKGFSADVFLKSSNAVTFDGDLINIDGLGNRVGDDIRAEKGYSSSRKK